MTAHPTRTVPDTQPSAMSCFDCHHPHHRSAKCRLCPCPDSYGGGK